MLTIAKTGQALIASPIFQGLPEAPAKEEPMEVDPAPETANAVQEVKDEKKAEEKVKATPKYIVPVDAATSDLVLEGSAYLRLLLILANLDAQRVKEVSDVP